PRPRARGPRRRSRRHRRLQAGARDRSEAPRGEPQSRDRPLPDRGRERKPRRPRALSGVGAQGRVDGAREALSHVHRLEARSSAPRGRGGDPHRVRNAGRVMRLQAPSLLAHRRAARIARAIAALALFSAACALVASLPVNAQDSARRRGFSIKITQPANQDFVIGKTKIAAEVKMDKPEAIEKVEFYVGDKLVFIDDEAPYECLYDFGPVSKNLVIKAVAYHRDGVTVSDFIVTRKIDISFNVKVNRV